MLSRSEGQNVVSIDIVIKNIKDMFQKFGTNSIECCALNRDFEEYILNSIKSYNLERAVKLNIYVSSREDSSDIDSLQSIIHKHFHNRAWEANLQLRQQINQWIVNMIIGVLFLVLCLILVEILGVFSYINIIKILKESLLIIGWVALWEPITFILFGWRNLKRDRLYHKKLSNISISIVKC